MQILDDIGNAITNLLDSLLDNGLLWMILILVMGLLIFIVYRFVW